MTVGCVSAEMEFTLSLHLELLPGITVPGLYRQYIVAQPGSSRAFTLSVSILFIFTKKISILSEGEGSDDAVLCHLDAGCLSIFLPGQIPAWSQGVVSIGSVPSPDPTITPSEAGEKLKSTMSLSAEYVLEDAEMTVGCVSAEMEFTLSLWVMVPAIEHAGVKNARNDAEGREVFGAGIEGYGDAEIH